MKPPRGSSASPPCIPAPDRRAYLVSRLGLMVALGLVLQILEGTLPPLFPLPGAKLGLANLATVITLVVMGPWEALAVNLLRCLLGGLLRGSIVGLTISLAAGTASTLVMMALYRLRPPALTLTGVSVAGAVTHNAAQLGVAMWLVGFPGLRYYLPYLLLLALPTGFLIGRVARKLIVALEGVPAYLGTAGGTVPSPSTGGEGHRPRVGKGTGWRPRAASSADDAPPRIEAGATAHRTAFPAGEEAAAAPPPLLLRGVSFTYPGRVQPALRGVDLEVGEGELVAVTGLNASGKSTLCRLANALLLPREGEVLVCGLDTSHPRNLREIRRSVSLIMQNPDHQIVASTVEDDIAFGLENLGLPREEIASRVEEIMVRLDLVHLRRRQPHLLSLGEKKRVALAGALAVHPRILVSDESTTMLDMAARREVFSWFLALREEMGLTVLHVTHHPEEIMAADRLVVLRDGKVAFDGAPTDLFLDEEAVCGLQIQPPPLLSLATELRARGLEKVPPRPLAAAELVEGIWASL